MSGQAEQLKGVIVIEYQSADKALLGMSTRFDEIQRKFGALDRAIDSFEGKLRGLGVSAGTTKTNLDGIDKSLTAIGRAAGNTTTRIKDVGAALGVVGTESGEVARWMPTVATAMADTGAAAAGLGTKLGAIGRGLDSIGLNSGEAAQHLPGVATGLEKVNAALVIDVDEMKAVNAQFKLLADASKVGGSNLPKMEKALTGISIAAQMAAMEADAAYPALAKLAGLNIAINARGFGPIMRGVMGSGSGGRTVSPSMLPTGGVTGNVARYANLAGIAGGEAEAGGIRSRLMGAGQNLGMAGMLATAGITMPIVGAGKDMLSQAADFQEAMNLLRAASFPGGGGPGADEMMAKVSQRAIELGKDLTLPATSATDAAKAIYELRRSGLDLQTSMDAAKGTLQLSAAANISNADAAKVAAAALHGFNMQGKDLTKVANILAATTNSSAVGVDGLANALEMGGSVAHNAGIDLRDFSAAIGEMANKGLSGEVAGTSLKGMLQRLETPTKAASKVMKEYGLNIYDAHGTMLPLRDLIVEFSGKLGKMTDEQRNATLGTIFGTKAIMAAQIVLDGGVESFDNMTGSIDRFGKAAEDIAAARMQGLKGALQGLQSQWETTGLTMATSILPEATDATNIIGKLVAKFGELDKGSQTTLMGIGAALALGGPVLMGLGALSAAVGALASGPGIAVLLAAGAALGVGAWAASKALNDYKSAGSGGGAPRGYDPRAGHGIGGAAQSYTQYTLDGNTITADGGGNILSPTSQTKVWNPASNHYISIDQNGNPIEDPNHPFVKTTEGGHTVRRDQFKNIIPDATGLRSLYYDQLMRNGTPLIDSKTGASTTIDPVTGGHVSKDKSGKVIPYGGTGSWDSKTLQFLTSDDVLTKHLNMIVHLQKADGSSADYLLDTLDPSKTLKPMSSSEELPSDITPGKVRAGAGLTPADYGMGGWEQFGKSMATADTTPSARPAVSFKGALDNLGGMWDAINKGLDHIVSGKDIQDIWKGLTDGSQKAGQDTGAGIAAGLDKSKPDVLKSITLTATDMQTTYQTVQDQHSPSRVFAKFGGNDIAGLVKGMDAVIDSPIASPKAALIMMTQGMLEVFSGGKGGRGMADKMRDEGAAMALALAAGLSSEKGAVDAAMQDLLNRADHAASERASQWGDPNYWKNMGGGNI